MASYSITPAYTTRVNVTGGREGHARSDDGALDINLKRPGASGGDPKATNPEQLFAAGYAACFQSALGGAARKRDIDVSKSVVSATVSLGAREDDNGFGISANLKVYIPDVDLATAQELTEEAHTRCPYSKATRGNIDVIVEAVEGL